MVEGSVRYINGGLGKFPRSVAMATEVLKVDMKLMRRYLNEEGRPDAGARVTLQEFTRVYKAWLVREGELGEHDKLPTKRVAELLRGEGVNVDSGTNNKTTVFGYRQPEPIEDLMRF